MSTTQRFHRDPAAPETAEKFEFGEEFLTLFTAGMGRIAELQKKTIEIAAQQNAEIIGVWKKAVEKLPGKPGLPVLEAAVGGFERYAEAQKDAIDLVVEQSQAFGNLMKERTAAVKKVNDGAVEFVKKSVERAVATQKKMLDHGAAQVKAAMEAAGKQPGYEGSPAEAAADSIQRGVNAIVDAQKELMDMAVR